MSLLDVVIVLIVIGVLLWLVNAYIPMDDKIKKILNIVVVVAVVIFILASFGILGRADQVKMPQVGSLERVLRHC